MDNTEARRLAEEAKKHLHDLSPHIRVRRSSELMKGVTDALLAALDENDALGTKHAAAVEAAWLARAKRHYLYESGQWNEQLEEMERNLFNEWQQSAARAALGNE